MLKIKFDCVIYINRRTYVYNINKVNALNVEEHVALAGDSLEIRFSFE